MRNAVAIAGEVAALPDARHHTARIDSGRETPGPSEAEGTLSATAAPAEDALVELERCAKALDDLQRTHRGETLSAVANGTLTAGEAMASVDMVRALDTLAHHAWRSAARLLGRDG
jgi:phosphate:Na+ symporter